MTTVEDVITKETQQAAHVLEEEARKIDREGCFPVEGVAVLRSSKLMGLLVPQELGGLGGGYSAALEVAQVLGGSCLSTAMVWAMHCQQVAVLVDHASEPLRTEVLRQVALNGLLIASVTSEPTKGGHLLTAVAPLYSKDEHFIVEREAPVVTSGSHADAFLITMRRSETATPTDIVLVYAGRDELKTVIRSDWDTLGVRGTASVAMRLSGQLPSLGRTIDPPGGFRRVAVTTMIPAGHLMWTACWLGAAKEAYRQTMRVLRNPSLRVGYPLKSDLYVEHIARVRMDIDLVEAMLQRVAGEYLVKRQAFGTEQVSYEDYAFNIHLNELKIAAAEKLFSAVDQTMQLLGLRYGYRIQKETSIERIFRDLRSARLMFTDDRLLVSNGKLALLDTSI
ncbi:MAG: acyl-CoA/acyl-ACP dehydrogenase [Propionibacteriaceae bacterium]|jgi:acyl-CoA dehydrogenase|nr:acyl-CoA/acyl-ACP dehydrogenase [Propionibacteriaceae bacterium]